MKTLTEYQNELLKLEKELATLPEGTLALKGKNYYQRIEQKEKGITKNPAYIHGLARKKYIYARIKSVKNILRTKNIFIDRSPQEIISSLPKTYQKLPVEYFFESTVATWISAPYKQNAYLPAQRKYLSNNGVALRSKSEVLIANQLEVFQIPYRYDAEVIIKGRTYYPDFVIRNPFNGQSIIWEHFGALHQPEYEQKMNQKMAQYLKMRLIPNETIIFTFEADVGNPERLQYLIEHVILKVI